MKNNLIVLILLQLSGCAYSVDNDFSSIEVFDKREVKGIMVLVQKMDSLIFNTTGNSNIDKAYHIYFNSFVKSLPDTSSFKNAITKFSKEIDSLSVFNQIWIKNDYANYSLGTVGEILNYNLNGKFMIYLKTIGEKNTFFKKLYDKIEEYNGDNWYTWVYFRNNFNQLKIHNQDDHIISAILLYGIVYDKKLPHNSLGTGKDNPFLQQNDTINYNIDDIKIDYDTISHK